MDKMTLRAKDWIVRNVDFCIAKYLVSRYHYSGQSSNTRVYAHGLFMRDLSFWEIDCMGVALWLPASLGASKNLRPDNPNSVLTLSRLVIHPDVPKNGASYLLGASMRMVDRARWPVLVTYADEWQGHTGGIYKATNWTYCGKTKPEAVYTLDGKMKSRKRGNKTFTHTQMLELGCVYEGKFSKHRFVHIVGLENGW